MKYNYINTLAYPAPGQQFDEVISALITQVNWLTTELSALQDAQEQERLLREKSKPLQAVWEKYQFTKDMVTDVTE